MQCALPTPFVYFLIFRCHYPWLPASKIHWKHAKIAQNCVHKESCAIAKMTAQCSNTWVPLKISGHPDYAHGYYCQHFRWAFVPIDPMNVPTKFEVRSFTWSRDKSCKANPQSRGRGSRRGSGMVPFERALLSYYRPSIVTSPLSLRVSEILPLMTLCSPERHFFPTSPLVSPKFPHVTLGQGGSPFGYKERRCRANCPCN